MTKLIAAGISSGLSRISNWWSGVVIVKRAYLVAFACFGIYVVIHCIAPSHDAETAFFNVAFFLFAGAFLREAYVWIIPKLELPLVKVLVAAVGVMTVAGATGVSRMALNEATGQDPAFFATTVALLVPVAFIPVLAFCIVVIGGVVISWAIILTFVKAMFIRPKLPNLETVYSGGRVLGCVVIVATVAPLVDVSSSVIPKMRWLASHGAFVFDLHSDVACGLVNNDRVLRINDHLVLIGRITEDGIQFVRRACLLSAEDTSLRSPKSVRAEGPQHSD